MTSPVRQPRLDDLTARFLAQTAAAPAQTADSEVEPHEVMGGFRTDPRTGWAEVAATGTRFGLPSDKLPAPPEWSAYAALPAPTAALPLAFGVFPQQVREPLPLLGATDLTAFLPKPKATVVGFTGLKGWAKAALAGKSASARLAATGLLALLGDTAGALDGLAAAETDFAGADRTAWQNQYAAVLWLAGRHADAVTVWETLAGHPAATFNLGMARLFLGNAAAAVPALKQAAADLDAASGWSHLANLLTLVAKARS
ncbi:MAG: tetratricopeptide repeat protein [Fimbriiglobus sp.]